MITKTKVINKPSNDIDLLSCWECYTGSAQENGRYRTSFNHRYLYNYDIIARIMIGEPINEWSHLCKNILCVRPTHLIDEDHSINMSRNSCPGNLYCPITKKVWILCTHNPRCLNIHILNKPMSIDIYKQL
jgi:hypothetical protein